MIRERTGRATVASATLLIAFQTPDDSACRRKTLAQPAREAGCARTHSAETSVLQLLVDVRGKLVEAFIYGHLFSHHLLQRLRPQRREIEEQRLGREVDLRARRGDFELLQIARVGLRDTVAELLIFPH